MDMPSAPLHKVWDVLYLGTQTTRILGINSCLMMMRGSLDDERDETGQRRAHLEAHTESLQTICIAPSRVPHVYT